ncbi:MAG: protein kinase [Planctomycetaceae bacterium]|nr:protein kinase [Planctomycetaceae bacterium]
MVQENKEGVGLPAGTQIGKYTIVSRIRIGGQAILYKAHEPLLDRDVAIKQISSHLAEDPAFLERFRNEARTLARLGAEQPAIVTIHELIEDPRGLFIVMEYVSGRTLEEVLAEQGEGLPVKAALQIIWRLAAALHTVHAAGIIHRDIKPANIFIGEGLRVKLADFGVAARKSGNTSMLLGTTKYMAPELLGGGINDERVDMYSLGFVAYEMLAGRRRFDEVFADVVRDKHAESLRWMKWHGSAGVSAPPLNEVNPAVPPVLAQIVAGMMAKDPAGRYESMEVLGRAIKSKFSTRGRVEPVGSVASDMHEDEEPESPEPVEVALPSAAEPSAGPATATLPRQPLPLKTKLMVGGAIFGMVVIGAIMTAIVTMNKDSDRGQKAKAAYKVAADFYGDRKYAEALPAFQKVQRDFGERSEAAKSGYYVHMCSGYLAIEKLDFDAAAASQNAAKKLLETIQAGPGKEDDALLAWTRGRTETTDLDNLRLAAKSFHQQLAKSKALLDEGKFVEARQQMDALGEQDRRVIAENARLQDEFSRHYAAIAVGKFRQEYQEAIAKGKEIASRATDKDGWDKAKDAYQQALAMLEGKTAQDVLPAAEREEAANSLRKKIADLSSTLNIAQLRDKIDQARKENDPVGEIQFLRQAVALTNDAADVQRIRVLEASFDYERAKKSDADGKHDQAIKQLQDLVAKYPEHPDAAALLKLWVKNRQFKTARREADVLFDKRDWSAAMDKYKEALTLQRDPYLTSRITDCRFNIQYAQAEAMEKADQLEQAIEAYNKAKTIKSDRDTIIETRQKAMRRELDYRAAMREGEVALAAQDWNRALEAYDRAKRLKNSAEVNKQILKTKYDRFMAMGEEAMNKRDFKAALANYKLARNVMDTPDVKEKIAHAQAMVEASEPQPAP